MALQTIYNEIQEIKKDMKEIKISLEKLTEELAND